MQRWIEVLSCGTNAYQYDAADGATVQSIYDALGRQIATVDGNGNRTDLSYDRNNRLIQRRNALLETERYTYDEQGVPSAYPPTSPLPFHSFFQ